MPLHENLMGRFKQADNGKILLHNIYAVFAFINHFDHLFKMTFSFLEIDKCFWMFAHIVS